MGLKRFDYKLPGDKKNYKSIVLVLCICMIAILSISSYALYKVQDKKDIINSKVGEFNTSDVSLAILINGEKSKTFPEKSDTMAFTNLECTNGGKAEWDSTNWKLSIIDISGPTECTVSFATGENAVTKLTELAKTNTEEMFIDDTTDANIRYMGPNPANYVDIGNENDSSGNLILWRIIGVMNNVDDGTGKKETRLKVIREKDVGSLAWDTNGKNNWGTASLSSILNRDYFNKQGSYTNTGLQTIENNLVQNAVYHLGGPTGSNYQSLTAKTYYEIERGETVYSGNPTSWTGKVGLMYASDYGYATSGGSTKDKAACAEKELSNWDAEEFSDCKNNDWLLNSSGAQWSIASSASYDLIVESVGGNGFVRNSYVGGAMFVHPVLYLKTDVKIVSGNGTKEEPYKLGA